MPKDEQNYCQNVSLDSGITSMQEHYALWVVPVISHKLQGATEVGTEATEVCP